MAEAGHTGMGAGEPLAASVGERLQAKARAEAEAARERPAGQHTHERAERHAADERADAAEHPSPYGAASPEGWRLRRDEARARGQPRGRDRKGRALALTGIALALAGLATRRRAPFWASLPILAGIVLLGRRLPAR